MSRQYHLFVYGSLLNPASASRALNKEINYPDYEPASIQGYRRCWNIGEQVFSDNLQRVITGAFLNIEPQAESEVSGAFLQITQHELERLKLREKNYSVCTLGRAITGGIEQITFCGKPEHLLLADHPDAWGLTRYIDMISDGCLGFGRTFSSDFTQTTERCPYPLLSGAYSFIDTTQSTLV
jgi:hypothetical protein